MAVDHFFEGGRSQSGKRKRQSINNGSAARPNGRRSDSRAATSVTSSRKSNGYKGAKLSRKEREQQDEVLAGSNESGSDNDDSAGDGDVYSREDPGLDSDEEAEARETPAQKRLRLATQYLDSLKAAQEDVQGIDAQQLERDYINDRLQEDVLEVSGRLHLRIAESLAIAAAQVASTSNKVHRLPVTCSRISDDCRTLFTCSKDGSLARWDISSLLSISQENSTTQQPHASTSSLPHLQISKTDFLPKKPSGSKSTKTGAKGGKTKGKAKASNNPTLDDANVHGHTNELYTLDISSDGSRLVTAGKDRRIGVWDITSRERGQGCKWVRGLTGHRDSIGTVKFRSGSTQVYSSSFDRSIKIYDAASLSYVETLYGHQDSITDIDVLRNELAVTAGARDKTVRYWKVRDESQLVFRAGTTSKVRRMLEGGVAEDIEEEDGQLTSVSTKRGTKANGVPAEDRRFVEGSADCVAMIDDQHFLSGGDSGSIALWSILKKKPIFTFPVAHGLQETHSQTEGLLSEPRWIVSLATLPYSDLFASGSWDGQIRLWRITSDLRSFVAAGQIPAVGVINSLQLCQLPGSRLKAGKQAKKANAGLRKGALLVASVAQEHKYGRWLKIKEAKNVALLAIIPESTAHA